MSSFPILPNISKVFGDLYLSKGQSISTQGYGSIISSGDLLFTGINGVIGTYTTITNNNNSNKIFNVPNISIASDFLVCRTSIDTLTNKTANDLSNNIYAKGIITTSGSLVTMNASTPTAGQLFTAITSSTFGWTNPIVESSISHLNIQNIGTNTHVQIDSHISNTNNPHNTTLQQLRITSTVGDILVDNGTIITALSTNSINGQILTVDSGSSLGISWQTPIPAVTTLNSIGFSPNSNAATITGNILVLQPANSSFGGVVTTLSQTFSGIKTFINTPIFASNSIQINDSGSGNSITISSPSLTSSFTLTLPTSDGASGQVIQTDGSGVLSFVSNGGISLAPIGSSPNANAALLSMEVLTLQPADGTNPGVMTAGSQTLGGLKTFNNSVTFSSNIKLEDPGASTNNITITAPTPLSSSYTLTIPTSAGISGQAMVTDGSGNLSFASAGGLTLSIVGSIPNSNAASISGNMLTLQPADGSNPGVITTGSQILSGSKTFNNQPLFVLGTQYRDPLLGGTNAITITSPTSLATSFTLTLPPNTGSNGQVLITNGSGSLSFTSQPTITIPLSSITDAIINNNIDNLNFIQTWNWSNSTTQNPFSMTANSLTSGNLLSLTSSSTSMTGSILLVSSTSTSTSLNGLVRFNFTGAHTGSGIQIDDITQTGNTIQINANSLTSGKAMNITTSSTGMIAALVNFSITSSNIGNTGSILALSQLGASNAVIPLNIGNIGTAATILTSSNGTIFTVTFVGRVGIGTANPNDQLEISGLSVRARITSTLGIGVAGIRLRNSTPYDWIIDNRGMADAPNHRIAIYNNTSIEVITITTVGNFGLSTNNPSTILSASGQVSQTFGLERNIVANTAGNSLTIKSSGSTLVSTDKNGGNLILSSGISTGTGTSSVLVQTYKADISGTSDNSSVNIVTFNGTDLSMNPHGVSAGNTCEIRFLELTSNGSMYVGFKAADLIPSNIIWTLPSFDGLVGQVLQTNGSGILSFTATPSGLFLPLNNIIAANGSATIDSLNNNIIWNWSTLNTGIGHAYNFNGLTSGTGISVVSSSIAITGNIVTLSTSGSNAANTGNILSLSQTGSLNAVIPLNINNIGTGSTISATSNGTAFVITSAGRLGVGTVTPNDQLEVSGGSIRARINCTSGIGVAGIRLRSPAPNDWYIDNRGTSDSPNNRLAVFNNAISEVLTILTGGNLGLSTNNPSSILSASGQVSQIFGLERNVVANIAGNSLTIRASGCTLASTDKNGGNLVLSSGISTGTGNSSVLINIYKAGGSGTSDNSSINIATFDGSFQSLNPHGIIAGNTCELRFLELLANGSNYVGFKSADLIAGNVIWTLPAVDGTSGQVLQTNGSSVLSWTSTPTITVPLSSITAAITTNTIDSLAFAQIWNWNTATTQSVFTMTSNALTSGNLLSLTSSSTGLTGSAFLVSSTSTAASTNGLIRFNFLGAHTGNGLQIDDITQTGNIIQINANSLTSGKAMNISTTSTGLTGSLTNLSITSSNAGNTGNLLLLTQSGALNAVIPLNISNVGTGATIFATSNGVAFAVTSAGRLGVGTSAPNDVAEISGLSTRIRITSTFAGGVSGIRLRTSAPNDWIIDNRGTADTPNNRLAVFNNASTEVLTILTGGNIGLQTTNPSSILSASGQVAQTFGLERNITSNTAGNSLTIRASGCTSLATDKAGGNLILSSGISTGTGNSSVLINIYKAGTTSTSDNSSVNIVTFNESFQSLNPHGIAAGNTGELRFLELTANGSMYVGFKAADLIPSNIIWTLPSSDGTSGQILQTNGSGILSFVTSTTSLNNITAATGTSIIDSTSNSITWDWNSINTTTGFTSNFNGLTSGNGRSYLSSATAFTGSLVNISLTGSNSANIGTLLDISSTGILSVPTLAKFSYAGTGDAINIIQTIAATAGVNNNSPKYKITGTYWTGSASASDTWTIQDVLSTPGSNPTSSITFVHAGSTGALSFVLPNFTTIKASGNNNFIVGGDGNTNTSTNISNVVLGGDSNSISGGSGARGLIAGGSGNTISATNHNNIISGGASNTISGSCAQSAIFGGQSNSTTATNHWNTTVGGNANIMSTGASYGTIVGGVSNTLSSASGGNGNTIVASSSCVMSSTGTGNVILSGSSATLAGSGSNTVVLGKGSTFTLTTPTTGTYVASSNFIQYCTFATPAGTTILAAELLNDGLTLTNGTTYTLPTAANINTALGSPSIFSWKIFIQCKNSAGQGILNNTTVNMGTGGTRQSNQGPTNAGAFTLTIVLLSASTYDVYFNI